VSQSIWPKPIGEGNPLFRGQSYNHCIHPRSVKKGGAVNSKFLSVWRGCAYGNGVAESVSIPPDDGDPQVQAFLAHLATDRGASVYTQRNYRAALAEFSRWHVEELGQPPAWDQFQRDDFRAYLRRLGRGNLGRAAIQLRFSALSRRGEV